jgi:transposase
LTLLSKKTKRASEADPEERAAFIEKQMTFPIERVWFLDEFGSHLAMTPTRARAPRGERAEVTEPFETGGNISVISALTLQGVRAPMMIKGAIDGEVLELYVKIFLVPELRSGDIVIWDNAPTHKDKQAISLIEAVGARVEPLPSYSPDLNPIEECFSKVKTSLRRARANTMRKLRNALNRAISTVTAQDIRGWINDSGYALP